MYRNGILNNSYMRSKNLPIEFYILAIGIIAMLFSIGTFAVYSKYMFGGNVSNINQMLIDNDYYLESPKIVEKTICNVKIDTAFGSFTARKRNTWGRGERTYTYYIGYLEDDSVFFIKTASQSDRDLLNKIVSETISSPDHKSKHSITLEGSVYEEKVGNPAKKYEYTLDKLGITSDGSSIKVRYLCLDTAYSRARLWGRCIIFFIIGIAGIFGNVIIYSYKNMQKKKMLEAEEAKHRAEIAAQNKESSTGSGVDIDAIKRKLNYNFETGEYMIGGTDEGNGDSESHDDAGDDEPRFGEGVRHERTDDGKISISGVDLFIDK